MNALRTFAAAVVIATAGAAMTGPAIASGTPTNWVNPNVEGSTTDSNNLLSATMSDTSAVSANANSNGCVSVAERPQLQASTDSSTGFFVKSQIVLTCALLTAGRNTYYLERARWGGGWEQLAPLTLTAAAGGAVTAQSVATHCRAGTWYYRVRSVGTNNFHTSSARHTCVKTTDLFYIDAT